MSEEEKICSASSHATGSICNAVATKVWNNRPFCDSCYNNEKMFLLFSASVAGKSAAHHRFDTVIRASDSSFVNTGDEIANFPFACLKGVEFESR